MTQKFTDQITLFLKEKILDTIGGYKFQYNKLRDVHCKIETIEVNRKYAVFVHNQNSIQNVSKYMIRFTDGNKYNINSYFVISDIQNVEDRIWKLILVPT